MDSDAFLEDSSEITTNDDVDRGLATELYQAVWENFYNWESLYCRRTIEELGSRGDSRCPRLDTTPILTTFDLRNARSLSLDEEFAPYPQYQICTPASKNLRFDDDLTTLPFVPFADDPSFSILEYLNGFNHLLWQQQDGCKDPDREIINLEVARQLCAQGFSYDRIDELRIVPRFRLSNESGLIWDNSQRDPLIWPPSLLSQDFLMSAKPLINTDLLGRVKRLLERFCPDLTCVEPHCPYHLMTQLPVFDAARKHVVRGTGCGDYCFQKQDVYGLSQDVFWEEHDIEMLSGILSIFPESSPCHLAVICHKHCWEVFVHRQHLIPECYESDQAPHENTKRRQATRYLDSASDGNIHGFAPVDPCSHKGACSAGSACPCVTNGLHCQRNCKCELKCSRRWRGCSCKSYPKLCGSDNCPCYKRKSECNPELCRRCCASQGEPCSNTSIQKGLFPNIEIRQSAHGLGAFATKEYKIGDFVGSYVGVAFSHTEYTDSLQIMNETTQRNYIFTLNNTTLVDAAEVGNEMRYLNHAAFPNNNCDASERLVDGKHHIALFATKKIQEGAELLLDYGERYWCTTKPTNMT